MANALRVWGDDSSNQFSGAPQGDVKVIAGGSINGLALRHDWTPFLWGQPPNPPPPNPIGAQPLPAALATQKFHGAAIGRDDAVLIRPDGTLDAFGQHAAIKNVPAGSHRAVTVAAVHAVAIAKDKTLTAWGSDSATTSAGIVITGLLNAPQGGPFKEVFARVHYSLALHEDGTLYGWGHDGIGAPSGTNVFKDWAPAPGNPGLFYIPNQTFEAIAAGNAHALAIKPDGTVTGWGNGTGGALNPPTHVRFAAVAAGWDFSIGLATDKTLWGWGTPFKSPFAIEAWTFASLASQGWTQSGNTGRYYVPNQHFKSIAAAAFHIMAITAGN